VVQSKEVTKLENSSVKLTLTIGKEDLRSEYNCLINKYSKSVQIPGFRKGKVPLEVMERKFGDAVKEETLGHVVEHAFQEIMEDESFVKENKPLPYANPSISDEENLKLDFDSDFTFSITYDVLPDVKVSEWKGLEIEIPQASVEKADIDRELEEIRDRNSLILDKDEKAKAAKDDVATINYSELDDDGNVLAGTEREDFVFTIGSGQNIYKIDDEIIGMKKGDTKDVTKNYAEDFEDPILAGKTKKLRVALTALKEKKLPDLDDDLAQDVNEKFKTLDDLKKDIQDKLEKNLENQLRNLKTNAMLEQIMEKTPITLPESMVRMELEARMRNLSRRFNVPEEQLMQIFGAGGKDMEAIQTEWRPDAEKALKSRLIVETLMEDLKLEASDEDVEKEMQVMADGSGSTLEEVKKYYDNDNMKEYLKEDIKEKKLFDMMIAESKIKKGAKKSYTDLMQPPQNG
jgi:trigger factor